MYIQLVYTIYMATIKKLISIRIREDVLDWFKQRNPNGYQTLMQAVLSDYVQKETLKQNYLLGRAQELFRSNYAQCFWHYDPNLIITSVNLHIVIEGLKKFGGRNGLNIAKELCQ